MAKNLVGHVKCPECGFDDAEVGRDKNGNLYRCCLLGCGAQFMTHGKPDRAKYITANMRPVGGAPAPAAAPAAKAPEQKASAAAPKKSGFTTLMG